ncbi:Nitrate/nitrite sensor protein narX [Raoultella planticola]|uniref:Nitrate/nitrite sensor protein narX n=1 Tax=Raoultella planticola TaxID=575 RepID=A0A485ARV3_RAOPL|nr:Nitrate/nitrite sensor protein narX [Raoultella planticola]
MNATVFSEELQNAALRDGQDGQLKALQQYWQLELAPGMKHAQNQATVATDVASFVDRIDHLVTSFDHTTEQRIRYVVWMQRVMAIRHGAAVFVHYRLAAGPSAAPVETAAGHGPGGQPS